MISNATSIALRDHKKHRHKVFFLFETELESWVRQNLAFNHVEGERFEHEWVNAALWSRQAWCRDDWRESREFDGRARHPPWKTSTAGDFWKRLGVQSGWCSWHLLTSTPARGKRTTPATASAATSRSAYHHTFCAQSWTSLTYARR